MVYATLLCFAWEPLNRTKEARKRIRLRDLDLSMPVRLAIGAPILIASLAIFLDRIEVIDRPWWLFTCLPLILLEVLSSAFAQIGIIKVLGVDQLPNNWMELNDWAERLGESG